LGAREQDEEFLSGFIPRYIFEDENSFKRGRVVTPVFKLIRIITFYSILC
jgi:hypothetical protein